MAEHEVTYRVMGRRTDGTSDEWRHQSREWTNKAEAVDAAKRLNEESTRDGEIFGRDPLYAYRVVKITSTLEDVNE